MNCTEYITAYLSAHADGELSGDELRRAQEHAGGCARCSRRLAEERQLKALVRKHAGAAALPAHLRERLSRALDEESHGRAGGIARLRRPAVWIPVAIAASVAIAIVLVRGIAIEPGGQPTHVAAHTGVADFDYAIAKYDAFTRGFHPNVPSSSFAEVGEAYSDAHMPGFIWDFHRSGIDLRGGRLDKLPDGRKVTYTFYAGRGGSILCMRFRVPNLVPPPGAAQVMADHYFYRYGDYVVCASYSVLGDFTCLLVSRAPLDQMVQNIMIASQ